MTYPPPPPPPPPALVFPITEYGDFQWYNRRNLLYLDTRFVIEVLLGQDNVDIQQGRKPGYNSSDIPNAPPNLIPQRIRINSIALIEKLTDISEEAFSGSSSVVFIRPFKMFVKHENAIRKALEQQEALVQELTQGMHTLMDMERAKTDAVALQGGALEHSTDSLHTSQSDTDCHDTPIKVLTDDLDTANGYGLAFQQWEDESTLCEHLRLLVHLFDGPLMPILDLYHSIRDGSADQIPFDYLWYLFEHGQEIIQQGPLWQIDSRIIVDQRLAILEITSWKPKNYNPTRTPADDDELFALPPSHGDYIHVDHNQDMGAARQWFSKQKHILESAEDLVSPPEEDRILLPHFLYGFVLRSRRWGKQSAELRKIRS
ncbi:hypothetical protein MPH_09993 [Macrophomina phaseolina MS6]|uniref:Uncharacterized protein n=1 Tax=Macrophomina phaseolina (strain MS6) TaxID=1126212 RepID=K2RRN1_MACPH|nr:hypothetical protein MPH_09993 [Macrophomina phaseolina MS6]